MTWEASDARMHSLKHGARFLPEEFEPVDDAAVMKLDAEVRSAKRPERNVEGGDSYLDAPLGAAEGNPGEWIQVHRAWPDFKDKHGYTCNQATSVASDIRCGARRLPGKWKGCGRGIFEARTRYINDEERVVDVRYIGNALNAK